MPHVTRNSILVVLLLVVFGMAIHPAEENLRLGKDLAGGVSLVYNIDVEPSDPPEVVDRTIEVLKERVNPRGLFEISFVQQGRDRIEITMPLPSEAVKAQRASFEERLAVLENYSIDASALERALRLEGQDRIAAVFEAMDSIELTPARDELLEAVGLVDRMEGALASVGQEFPGTDEQLADTRDQRIAQLAAAEVALDELKDTILSRNVSVEQMRRALELPDQSIRFEDPEAEGGELVIQSQREQAIMSIRDRLRTYEGTGAIIDEVIAQWDQYTAIRRGLDDPSDLIRLLQGAGVLNFRIGVRPGEVPDEARLREELRERGPAGVQSENTVWIPINSIRNWYDAGNIEQFRALQSDPSGYLQANYGLVAEERDGRYYILLYDEPGLRITQAEGSWSLTNAFPQQDQYGRPSIGFQMDPRGASLLGDLTGENRQRPMAIVLDDEIYTSATIISRISQAGQITGTFSNEEIQYIVRTLAAGSLQAKLGETPISQSTIAPDLGQDNLDRGLAASAIALVAVAAFMILYYFTSGAVAIVALACNGIIILGIMSLARASFTLPGIAGIVLTFGTAVDANVLIYERIREELLGGNDLRDAVRVAFKKVSSTIVDANVTNLIVCFVLGFYGTQEIKGFGITLGIGVIGTMFCSLVITRLLFVIMVEKMKINVFRHQLPTAVPAVDRLLTPNINWMALRPLFIVISIVGVGLGISLISIQGKKMLDVVFLGGVQFEFVLQEDDSGERMTMTRSEVQDRVRAEAESGEGLSDEIREGLTTASVLPINPDADGVTSTQFQIRTAIDEDLEDDFEAALVEAFGDVVESQPALRYEGWQIEDLTSGAAPVYPLLGGALGPDIGDAAITDDASEYAGGAAIVLEFSGSVLPSRQSIVDRIDLMRRDPLYSGTALGRPNEVIVLRGSDDSVQAAALLVSDAGVSFLADEDAWRAQFAQQEWNLVQDALTSPTILASVNSFSPAVAATFRANAIFAVILSFVLILIYVWVRFGSVRYSVAAIVPLVHDVLVAIGLIALAEILYEASPGVASVGIRPFKIDMGLVAAILAIVGYSLNDTIVILDRIRENRGRLVNASKEVINKSINQTFSRTLITTCTTLLSLLVLFFLGGEGVASFSYALICGMIVGTYSSIGVAAPIVFNPRVPPAASPYHTPDAVTNGEGEPGALPAPESV